MFCFNNIYAAAEFMKRGIIVYRDVIKFFGAVIFCAAVTGGCVPAVPCSPCDEIRLYEWEICSDKRNDSGELSFKGDELYMYADVSGSKTSVKGRYFIDDKRITVFADGFDILQFDYKLSGEKLLLSYFSKKLTFKKRIIVQN